MRWRDDPGAALKQLERFWSGAELQLLADAAERDQWQPVIARLPDLQRSLRKHRPYSPKMLLVEAERRVRRAFQPTGLMVALIGPDGCGKSSVIQQALVSLAPAFRHTKCIHLRPRLGMHPSTDRAAVMAPHGQAPYGALVSMLKLLYLWFDYTAGYMWIIYPKLAAPPSFSLTAIITIYLWIRDAIVLPFHPPERGSLANSFPSPTCGFYSMLLHKCCSSANRKSRSKKPLVSAALTSNSRISPERGNSGCCARS